MPFCFLCLLFFIYIYIYIIYMYIYIYKHIVILYCANSGLFCSFWWNLATCSLYVGHTFPIFWVYFSYIFIYVLMLFLTSSYFFLDFLSFQEQMLQSKLSNSGSRMWTWWGKHIFYMLNSLTPMRAVERIWKTIGKHIKNQELNRKD